MGEEEAHSGPTVGVGDHDEVHGSPGAVSHQTVQGPSHFEPQIRVELFCIPQIDENKSEFKQYDLKVFTLKMAKSPCR